ncbi:uncharacterized protein LY89DRAFT_692188 [Mollisia scopiformis]|uniref:Uncharacterized protein n=1 Tax=Mollisia scopiformis TaxID=149040 RepID=A0A132B3K5_MOLSC|nr:uncharacterized protein LY89DRAFT_692188 [Mollisia scopiformis]KUJ06833.1 hypothetical protein LY89DRAFT_692188 [Mollisia scopiformis]
MVESFNIKMPITSLAKLVSQLLTGLKDLVNSVPESQDLFIEVESFQKWLQLVLNKHELSRISKEILDSHEPTEGDKFLLMRIRDCDAVCSDYNILSTRIVQSKDTSREWKISQDDLGLVTALFGKIRLCLFYLLPTVNQEPLPSESDEKIEFHGAPPPQVAVCEVSSANSTVTHQPSFSRALEI